MVLTVRRVGGHLEENAEEKEKQYVEDVETPIPDICHYFYTGKIFGE